MDRRTQTLGLEEAPAGGGSSTGRLRVLGLSCRLGGSRSRYHTHFTDQPHTACDFQPHERIGTRAARLPTSLHQLQSRCIGSRSAALSRGRGVPSGVRLLTVAIVQEVSDEAGTAGGPGLLGVHVSHHRGHDMVGGAPRPIQTHAWL